MRKEGWLNLLSLLKKPDIHQSFDPRNQQQVIKEIQKLLTDNLYQELDIITQVLDPFNQWLDCSFQEAVKFIIDEINLAYQQTRQSDASRFINRIGFNLWRDPWLIMAPKMAPKVLLLTNIWIEKTTRLGDGPRYFNEATRQWEFVQRKGAYFNIQHLLLRQLTAR